MNVRRTFWWWLALLLACLVIDPAIFWRPRPALGQPVSNRIRNRTHAYGCGPTIQKPLPPSTTVVRQVRQPQSAAHRKAAKRRRTSKPVGNSGMRGVQLAPIQPPVLLGTKWAVIIGINSYKRAPLKYAREDATAIRDTLRDLYGFTDNNIVFLSDNFATKAGILDAFGPGKLGNRMLVREGDEIFVFFAGHGANHHQTNGGTASYLEPVDAGYTNGQAKLSSLISFNELLQCFDHVASRRVFFMCDCCFSGGLFAAKSHRGSTVQALTAGKEQEVEADHFGNEHHSVFTHFVLQLLRRGADHGVVLTASDMMRIIPPKVRDATGDRQHPLSGYLDGVAGGAEFYFVRTDGPQVPGALVDTVNFEDSDQLRIEASKQLRLWLERQPVPNRYALAEKICHLLGVRLRWELSHHPMQSFPGPTEDPREWFNTRDLLPLNREADIAYTLMSQIAEYNMPAAVQELAKSSENPLGAVFLASIANKSDTARKAIRVAVDKENVYSIGWPSIVMLAQALAQDPVLERRTMQRAVGVLTAPKQQDQNVFVRLSAAQWLLNSKDSRGLAFIVRQCNSPIPALRSRAVELLEVALAHNPRYRDQPSPTTTLLTNTLLTMRHSPYQDVRAHAYSALAKSSIPGMITPWIAEQAAVPQQPVPLSAESVAIPSQSSIEEQLGNLCALAEDSDPAVRRKVVDVLADWYHRGYRQFVKNLQGVLLRHEHDSGYRPLLEALVLMDDREALRVILQEIDTEWPNVEALLNAPGGLPSDPPDWMVAQLYALANDVELTSKVLKKSDISTKFIGAFRWRLRAGPWGSYSTDFSLLDSSGRSGIEAVVPDLVARINGTDLSSFRNRRIVVHAARALALLSKESVSARAAAAFLSASLTSNVLTEVGVTKHGILALECRAAGVSLEQPPNAEVPATEVSAEGGHSVEEEIRMFMSAGEYQRAITSLTPLIQSRQTTDDHNPTRYLYLGFDVMRMQLTLLIRTGDLERAVDTMIAYYNRKLEEPDLALVVAALYSTRNAQNIRKAESLIDSLTARERCLVVLLAAEKAANMGSKEGCEMLLNAANRFPEIQRDETLYYLNQIACAALAQLRGENERAEQLRWLMWHMNPQPYNMDTEQIGLGPAPTDTAALEALFAFSNVNDLPGRFDIEKRLRQADLLEREGYFEAALDVCRHTLTALQRPEPAVSERISRLERLSLDLAVSM